ncbi:MAG: twin-arginine translocase TatA/TatE family subunit [Deltaproteobacteria bacterium]|nr:twin-arginine translocase TatA/TatE family subunit [Deltaproteobacteria bacterium]
MGRFGMGELIVILIIVLIIFGAGKLPQIGEALGRSIRGFKKGVADEEKPAAPQPAAPSPAAKADAPAPPEPEKKA